MRNMRKHLAAQLVATCVVLALSALVTAAAVQPTTMPNLFPNGSTPWLVGPLAPPATNPTTAPTPARQQADSAAARSWLDAADTLIARAEADQPPAPTTLPALRLAQEKLRLNAVRRAAVSDAAGAAKAMAEADRIDVNQIAPMEGDVLSAVTTRDLTVWRALMGDLETALKLVDAEPVPPPGGLGAGGLRPPGGWPPAGPVVPLADDLFEARLRRRERLVRELGFRASPHQAAAVAAAVLTEMSAHPPAGVMQRQAYTRVAARMAIALAEGGQYAAAGRYADLITEPPGAGVALAGLITAYQLVAQRREKEAYVQTGGIGALAGRGLLVPYDPVKLAEAARTAVARAAGDHRWPEPEPYVIYFGPLEELAGIAARQFRAGDPAAAKRTAEMLVAASLAYPAGQQKRAAAREGWFREWRGNPAEIAWSARRDVVKGLREAAEIQLRAGDKQLALRTLDQAIRAVETIDDEQARQVSSSARGEPLRRIAEIQLACGDDAGAITSLRKARELAKRMPSERTNLFPFGYEYALGGLYAKSGRADDLAALVADTSGASQRAAASAAIVTYAATDRTELALALIDRAGTNAAVQVFSDAARRAAAAGDRPAAVRHAAAAAAKASRPVPEETSDQDKLLRGVAVLQAELGDYAGAAETVRAVYSDRENTVASLVGIRARGGDDAGAMAQAKQLGDAGPRANAYVKIGAARLTRGDRAGADAAYRLAIDAAVTGSDTRAASRVAALGISALYGAGDVTTARAVSAYGARAIAMLPRYDEYAWAEWVAAQVDAGDPLGIAVSSKDIQWAKLRSNIRHIAVKQVIRRIVDGRATVAVLPEETKK